MPDSSSPIPSIDGGPSKKKDQTVGVSKDVADLIKKLAEHYGDHKVAVVEAAVILLHDRVEGIDAIQIPELVSAVADLEETVGQLVVRAEQMERLAFELAAFEITRRS